VDLQLANVKVRLPQREHALFQISQLKIPFGSHILIHGPSGVGKTTLLHLLAGLFVPDDGHVYVGDHNLSKLSDPVRAQLRRQHFGIVFQKLNLLEHLTGFENIMLAEERSTTESRKRAEQALAQVQMSSARDQLSATMSLGEQQRVAVARVLARAPEIILADEPTSSLDADKAAKGKTLIVVSHDERIRPHFTSHFDFRQWVSA
jgi:putative ABC transport system ATP-binding protein